MDFPFCLVAQACWPRVCFTPRRMTTLATGPRSITLPRCTTSRSRRGQLGGTPTTTRSTRLGLPRSACVWCVNVGGGGLCQFTIWDQPPSVSSRPPDPDRNLPFILSDYFPRSCGNLSSTTYLHLGYTGTQVCSDPDRQIFTILLTNRVYPTGISLMCDCGDGGGGWV